MSHTLRGGNYHLKLLPGPIRFTKGFAKRYILLRQVLFETRLHHWLDQLEVITHPGLVIGSKRST